MPTYTYQGVSQQHALGHPNHVVALKIDPASNPPIEILGETIANPDGSFVIEWDDWSGRVAIGVVDDDETIKLQCVFKDFLQANISADINVTNVPVYPLLVNDKGVSITSCRAYVIKKLNYNLNGDVPPQPSFDLTQEII